MSKPKLNDYVFLVKMYCKNYKQYQVAISLLRQRAVGHLTLAEQSTGEEKDYHVDKAARLKRMSDEIAMTVANLDAALETLTDVERKVIQDWFIDHIPLALIDGMSKSTFFRIVNKAVDKLAVCLFGKAAQREVAMI